MAGPLGERTHKPTPKRLKDARERGQVATSRDLSTAVSSLAATSALIVTGSFVLERLGGAVAEGLARMGRSPVQDLHPEDLSRFVVSSGMLLALVVGPVALVAAAAGVMSTTVQSGFALSTSALQLNWQRLSPATGIKRLAPSRSGVDTLKAIVTAAVMTTLAWRIGRGLADDAVRLVWGSAPQAAARGWLDALRLLLQTGLALLAVGGIDYGVQRWRLWSALKMTRQELIEETKSGEVNPQVKAKVRRIQRDMMRRRMFQAVPRATVVITNPTHYAVALEYRREQHAAPIVVAKGRDLVAQRIRAIALEHSIPIVEDPPLARGLFKGAEIGDAIPAPLFGAVAEVLAYLIRIKQLVL